MTSKSFHRAAFDQASNRGLDYLRKMPVSVRADRVLVHNQVYPVSRRPGTRGSRRWLEKPNPAKLELCACGWAAELGKHFRVRRV